MSEDERFCIAFGKASLLVGEIGRELEHSAVGKSPTHGEGAPVDGLHFAGMAADVGKVRHDMGEARLNQAPYKLCACGRIATTRSYPAKPRSRKGLGRIRIGNDILC